MKNRKICFALIMILMLCFSAFVGACSCNSNDGTPIVPQETGKKVSVNYYAYELNIYDDFQLVAQTTEVGAVVVWSSSDPTIATVDENGNVYPKAVGNTVVSATVGEDSAQCYITVVDDNILPVLRLNKTTYKMLVDDENVINASVLYKSEAANGAQVFFESMDSSIVTVDAKGNIKALSKGTARIKVTATWKSIDATYLTEYVEISVLNDVAVRFDVQEVNVYAVANLGGETYNNEQEVSVNIYKDGVQVSGEAEVSVEDESIATYENGKIIGQKVGVTKLLASVDYEGVTYTDFIEVNVDCALTEYDGDFVLSKLDADMSVLFDKNTTVSKAVRLDGDGTEYLAVNNVLQNVSEIPNESRIKLAVYGDKYGYILDDVRVIDLYITKESQINVLRSVAIDGYVELGADIDLLNESLVATSARFGGVFDGKGYSIKNANLNKMNTSNQAGFFGSISGTIKNVAFVNTTLTGVQGGALACRVSKGAVIENVYISVSFVGGTNHSGGIARNIESNDITLKNCVIYVKSDAQSATTYTYEDGDVVTGSSNGAIFSYGYGGAQNMTFENTYVVSDLDKTYLVGIFGSAAGGAAEYTFNETYIEGFKYSLEEFDAAMSEKTVTIGNEKLCNAILGISWTEINTVDDFFAMRKSTSGNYKLMKDLDLNSVELTATSGTFYGTFNGNGHKLINLKFTSGSGNGLFATLSGSVKNLAIVNATLNGQGGVICNTVSGSAVIDNVYISVKNISVEGTGVLFRNCWSVPVVKNCVVYVKAVTPATTYTHTYLDSSIDVGRKVGMIAYDGGSDLDCSTVKFVTDVTNLLPLSVTSTKTYTAETARQAFIDNNPVYSVANFNAGILNNTISVGNLTLAKAVMGID